MKRVFLATAVSAALAVGASAVFAQSVEQSETLILAAAAGEVPGTPGAAQERRFRSASERIEARLAHIQKALQITSAQQTQWDSFANVMRRHARDIDERIQARRAQGQQAPGAGNVTAIERLERMQRMTAERYNRLGEVIAAAKPLYDVLSPEQKQAADQMLARRGRGGHHKHHRAA